MNRVFSVIKNLFGLNKEQPPICYKASVKHPGYCKGPDTLVEYGENVCADCKWYREIEAAKGGYQCLNK